MANDKNKLFETIYLLWKGEGEKHNQSIDWYCEQHHVKVEDFRQWYKSVHQPIKEVQVIGRPVESGVTPASTPVASSPTARIVIDQKEDKTTEKANTISVSIKTGNGLHITRKGMSYSEFLNLAQNLKALC